MALTIDKLVIPNGPPVAGEQPMQSVEELEWNGTQLLINGVPALVSSDNTAYAKTVWVDENGSATVDGTNPSQPTTFANAISNLAFSTHIILAESTVPYTTGGPVTIDQSNVTITAIQGGTGSDSTSIADAITIGSGVTSLRAYGVTFNAAVHDNGSDGRHFFAWCSLGAASSFTRTNPQRGFTINESDFSAGSFTITGTGSNSAFTKIVGSSSSMGSKTLSATSHTTWMYNNAQASGITITNGTLRVTGCTIIGAANCINASAGTTVLLHGSQIRTLLWAPQTITLAGNHNIQNTIFDEENSTITGATDDADESNYSGTVRAKIRSRSVTRDRRSVYATETLNYTYDHAISIDASSNAVTVTLDVGAEDGREFDLFCVDSTNTVTIIGTVNDTVNPTMVKWDHMKIVWNSDASIWELRS